MTDLDEPIHLCAYDQGWPALFASEAARIAAGLSADVAIEHIGSTAVPGLLAKPIIDVMVGRKPGANLAVIRSELASLGYEDMGEAGVPGRLHFRRRAANAFNVALVERGGSIWNANLALRNYLRAHPEAAQEYAETKRSAVEGGFRSLLAYSDYKREIVARLISRALNSPRASPHDR